MLSEEGVTLLHAGDYPGALALFEQAISSDPGYLPARVNRGIALLSLRRAQDALLSFEIVLDWDPGNTPAWMYRGDALSALGRVDDARESYVRAASLEPDNPLIKERLSTIRPAESFPSVAGIPLFLLVFCIALISVAGVAAMYLYKWKGLKSSHQTGEEKQKKPLLTISPFSKLLKKNGIHGKSAQGNISDANENPAISRAGVPGKHSMFGRAASIFKRNARSAKKDKPVVPTASHAMKNPGPLEMAGSIVHSSGEENGAPGVRGNKDQIIGGFDRILAGAGIDASGFRGLSHYAMGNYKDAIREFNEDNLGDKEYPGIIALKASALLRMGNAEEALRTCETALGDGRNSYDLRKIQVDILGRLGRWEETLVACDEVLALNPHSVKIWAMRAQALHALGKNHEALQASERALGMDPASSDLIGQKAEVLASLGRVDEALSTLDLGISSDPRDTTLLVRKGRILHAAGRSSDALKEFDSALAIAPDDHAIWSELAKVLHSLGNPLEEAAAWERASALSPNHSGYFAAWGKALAAGGDHAASVNVFLKAIRISPHDLTLWHSLGQNLCASGKFIDAAKAFQIIIRKSPGDGEAWKMLGYSLLGAGRAKEALSAFRKAEPLLPGNPGVAEGIRRAMGASREESPDTLPDPGLDTSQTRSVKEQSKEDTIRIPRGSTPHDATLGKTYDQNAASRCAGDASDPAYGVVHEGSVLDHDARFS